MVWKEFNHDLKPYDWGWYAHDGKLMPFQTDQATAPSEILDAICCKCTIVWCKVHKKQHVSAFFCKSVLKCHLTKFGHAESDKMSCQIF